MPTHAFVQDLRAAARAGVPIVCIVTHEERRALDLIGEAFGGRQMATWRSTDGWTGIPAEHPASAAHGGPATLTSGARSAPALPDAYEAARRASRPAPGVVYVVLDLHPWLNDPRVVRALRDVAGVRREMPLVLVMPQASWPPELDRDVRLLALPLPDRTALGAALEAAGLELRGAGELLVRAALGLTLDEAARAFRAAKALGDPDEALCHVMAEKRRTLRRSACLELLDADVALGDVGGLEVLKGWVQSRVLAFDAGAQAFGLAEPRGMLVCGVQGCGKSLVSKAAARVLGLPLVRLDFAEVFAASSPEHAILEATRAVETVAPVVLWVDEIEKGLGAESEGARNARVFGAFLTWLQERRSPVFVAATANEVDRLPPELARRGRFDEVFFVDLPSSKERADILTVHLRRRGRSDAAYPVADLTRELEHWSGAEIEQMVTSALFRAYAEKHELTEDHLRAAARELVPLATLYEEKIQALRQWGQSRARRASADRRTLDLFGD